MTITLQEFARLGGKARAAKLTKERKIEIARNAGLASASKRQLASKQDQCHVPESPKNKV